MPSLCSSASWIPKLGAYAPPFLADAYATSMQQKALIEGARAIEVYLDAEALCVNAEVERPPSVTDESETEDSDMSTAEMYSLLSLDSYPDREMDMDEDIADLLSTNDQSPGHDHWLGST